MFAMVPRQLFRMTLPVSARASSSSSASSSAVTSSPTTARTSSRLFVSGKISKARPEKAPAKSCLTATKSSFSRCPISAAAALCVTISTAGTESSTWRPTILRRLAAARLTPILTTSVKASRSRSSRAISVCVHSRTCLSRSAAPERKPDMPSAVSGLLTNVAFTARARAITSSWMLAVMIAMGM